MIYNIQIFIVEWIPPSDQHDLLVASHSDFDKVPCKTKIFYIKKLFSVLLHFLYNSSI